MDAPKDGKRRFAPVPIETTFEQYRQPGPAGELTPDPSPTSPPHVSVTFEPPARHESPSAARHESPHIRNESPRGKRRFAPQLIDSSRRSRRMGDVGPATRPVDKTDIVPYHNHIYSVSRTKKRHNKITGLARRESCDEETADHMFNLATKEIEKRLQEIALSAFPNSGVRIGGAEHFVVREGSEDDSIEEDERGRPEVRVGGDRPRRESTEEDINWHVREAQNAADRRARSRMDTRELDLLEMDSPPPDTMWLTTSRKQTPSPGPSHSPFLCGPIGETHMPLISNAPLKIIGESLAPPSKASPPAIQPIGEYQMPYIPSAPLGKAGDMAFIPAETGFQRHGGFRREAPADKTLEALRLRSPPMLGKDIKFRMCPSPKRTKLEPDHLWTRSPEANNRDPTGEHGLWRGYCYTAETGEVVAAMNRPGMISTPGVMSADGTDPFSSAFAAADGAPTTLSEEPTPLVSPGAGKAGSRRSVEAKGIHMLAGLDERLRREKAAAELDEQIQGEFTERFVTQVYNYLSLGYPAMARSYDEELSKISRIPVEELRREDDALMHSVVDSACEEGGDGARKGAKGHMKLVEDDETSEQDRCPRWKALKLYVNEWARQHPDLDSISPLAWGVRERRGSWGI